MRIRSDGSGGDEWIRSHRGRQAGIPSPIRQAARQSEILRTFLQRNREALVGRHRFGWRTLATVMHGTEQRGFVSAPMQLVVAVSDSGIIEKIDGWKEPQKPFRTIVGKADTIPDKLRRELERHREGARWLRIRPTGEYGLWTLAPGEAAKVASYLAARHADRSVHRPVRVGESVPRGFLAVNGIGRVDLPPTGEPACKHCESRDLIASSGRYGYFWICGSCGKNTSMPLVCSACGAKGRRDAKVKIRKKQAQYFRDCGACGSSESVWSVE